MTAEEHAHVQELEGLVKRYRSRIVELKAEKGYLGGFAALEAEVARLTAERDQARAERDALKGNEHSVWQSSWWTGARSLAGLSETRGNPAESAICASCETLRGLLQIKDAAVGEAIRRAEKAEQRLEIATELLKAQTMEHYFK